jgi:probable phosphoglycerate mutase
MTRVYFVRHCEAEGNTRGVLQGRSDCDVSGNSAKQLALVSLRLRNVPFTAFYSSPLKRAYKTAQAIDRYHDLEIRKDRRLIEIDMGDWEGRSWADIEKESPAMLRVWNENPGEFQAPNGESLRQVCDRMWNAAQDIARGKRRGNRLRRFARLRHPGASLPRAGETGRRDRRDPVVRQHRRKRR